VVSTAIVSAGTDSTDAGSGLVGGGGVLGIVGDVNGVGDVGGVVWQQSLSSMQLLPPCCHRTQQQRMRKRPAER